jgi:hypothetical protein
MEKYIAITLIAYIINFPMGILVARSKKLGFKLLYIHLSVPILAALRITWQLKKYYIAVIILVAVIGQLTGKWIYNRRQKSTTNSTREVTD